jgi:porphobilinogen deaminase
MSIKIHLSGLGDWEPNLLQILKTLPVTDAQIRSYNSESEPIGELLNTIHNEANLDQMAVIPADAMPYQLPESLVAAAILDRVKPLTRIIIPSDALDYTQDFFIQSGKEVYCIDENIKAQIQAIRPDLNFKDTIENTTINIIPFHFASGKPGNEWEELFVIPEEIAPRAGSGVVVAICKKNNLALRRLLKAIHNEQTAWCSNLERKIAKHHISTHGIEPNIFVQLDSANHFHLFAVRLAPHNKEIQSIRLSMSTARGLENSINSAWDLTMTA